MGWVHLILSLRYEPVDQFDPFRLEEIRDALEFVEVHAVYVRERRSCWQSHRFPNVIADKVGSPSLNGSNFNRATPEGMEQAHHFISAFKLIGSLLPVALKLIGTFQTKFLIWQRFEVSLQTKV